MRDHQQELADQRIDVKVITFDDDVMTRRYIDSSGLEWPILIDTRKESYQAYGLGKASWWELYHPATIAKYIWLMIRGTMPGRPGSDLKQLGGDVMIGPDQIVRMIHLSQGPHDRPSVEQILGCV